MANMARPSSSKDCLEIPGYKFWIEIVRKKAKHYQVHKDNNVVSCFIASEANQEFRIFCQKDSDALDTRAKFYINGDIVDTHLFKPEDKNGIYRLSRIRTERGKQRFAFASVNVTDDEHANISSAPEELGTIRIDMYRVKNICKVPGDWVPKTFNLRDVSIISEKSKSIGFQTISLQPPEPATDQTNKFVYLYDYEDKSSSRLPWYTIKFFYRTLDILRAQGIAPASSSSGSPITNKSPISVPRVMTSAAGEKPSSTAKVSASQSNMNKSEMTKAPETIVIEDSDSEDKKFLPKRDSIKVKTESSKRPRESSGGGRTLRSKRVKKPCSPAIIVVDSD